MKSKEAVDKTGNIGKQNYGWDKTFIKVANIYIWAPSQFLSVWFFAPRRQSRIDLWGCREVSPVSICWCTFFCWVLSIFLCKIGEVLVVSLSESPHSVLLCERVSITVTCHMILIAYSPWSLRYNSSILQYACLKRPLRLDFLSVEVLCCLDELWECVLASPSDDRPLTYLLVSVSNNAP